MKIFSINKNSTVILLFFLLTNCITTLAPGLLYNSTSEHIPSYDNTPQLGPGRILKKAESCEYNSIFIQYFYYGKPSTPHLAAKEAGITKIGVVDYSSFSIFGPLFYKHCTIVWGDIE